jgi:uncharacterized DUF497 family protein
MPAAEDDTVVGLFEWDPDKNRTNVRKHEIDFGDALQVFSDPAAIVVEARRVHGEQRQLIVGRAGGNFMTVVFTVRGERIRLISARRSRSTERKRYGQ